MADEVEVQEPTPETTETQEPSAPEVDVAAIQAENARLRQEFERAQARQREIEEENERFAELLGTQQQPQEQREVEQRAPSKRSRGARGSRGGRRQKPPAAYFDDFGEEEEDGPDPRDERVDRLERELSEARGQIQGLNYHLSQQEHDRQARKHVKKKDYPLTNEYGIFDRVVGEAVRGVMAGERGWDAVRWKRRLKETLDQEEHRLREVEGRRLKQYQEGKAAARQEVPAVSAGSAKRAPSEPKAQPPIDWRKGDPFEAIKRRGEAQIQRLQARRNGT